MPLSVVPPAEHPRAVCSGQAIGRVARPSGAATTAARPIRAGDDPDDDDLGDDEPLTPEQPLPDEDSAFEDFDDEFDDDFEEDEHDPDWDHPDEADPGPPPPPAKGPARKK
jgi:hypothetical protein